MPQASANPTLSDTSLVAGGVLSVSTPSWSPAVTTNVAYQWQESSNNSSWSDISGATNSSYTITQHDSQQFIRVRLVATNGAGSSTLTSGSDQVGKLSAAAVITAPPALSGGSSVGSTLQLSGGNYTNSSGVTVTFERCARSCSTAQSGSSTSYRLQKADVGYYMVATVTVAGIDGGASATAGASGIVGPVISPLGGALQIGAANATIKSSTNGALLTVKRTITKPKSKKARGTELRPDTDPRRPRERPAQGLGVRPLRHEDRHVYAGVQCQAPSQAQAQRSGRRSRRGDRRPLNPDGWPAALSRAACPRASCWRRRDRGCGLAARAGSR